MAPSSAGRTIGEVRCGPNVMCVHARAHGLLHCPRACVRACVPSCVQEYQWINFREQKYLMRLQHEAEMLDKLTQ